MVAGTSLSQLRTWVNDAAPDDLVSIAPLLFSRIDTLDQPHQDRLIQEVQRDPKAKRLFEKMQAFSR